MFLCSFFQLSITSQEVINMESEENQELQISFYMMMFMIIESTLEVGNITQVKSDGCV